MNETQSKPEPKVDPQAKWLAAKNDDERAAAVRAHPELAQIYLRAQQLLTKKQPK